MNFSHVRACSLFLAIIGFTRIADAQAVYFSNYGYYSMASYVDEIWWNNVMQAEDHDLLEIDYKGSAFLDGEAVYGSRFAETPGSNGTTDSGLWAGNTKHNLEGELTFHQATGTISNDRAIAGAEASAIADCDVLYVGPDGEAVKSTAHLYAWSFDNNTYNTLDDSDVLDIYGTLEAHAGDQWVKAVYSDSATFGGMWTITRHVRKADFSWDNTTSYVFSQTLNIYVDSWHLMDNLDWYNLSTDATGGHTIDRSGGYGTSDADQTVLLHCFWTTSLP